MNATPFKVHSEVMCGPTCFFGKQVRILLCFFHRSIQSMVRVKMLKIHNPGKVKKLPRINIESTVSTLLT